jgi:hypothetical protein
MAGFAAIADHFIAAPSSASYSLAAMAEYFIVASYYFESVVTNSTIHAKIQSDMLQSIR